jgi:hypothetical protein
VCGVALLTWLGLVSYIVSECCLQRQGP